MLTPSTRKNQQVTKLTFQIFHFQPACSFLFSTQLSLDGSSKLQGLLGRPAYHTPGASGARSITARSTWTPTKWFLGCFSKMGEGKFMKIWHTFAGWRWWRGGGIFIFFNSLGWIILQFTFFFFCVLSCLFPPISRHWPLGFWSADSAAWGRVWCWLA